MKQNGEKSRQAEPEIKPRPPAGPKFLAPSPKLEQINDEVPADDKHHRRVGVNSKGNGQGVK